MKCSLIISTYNRPDALLSVLNSLNDQTCSEFEAVIADDGSNKETRRVIEDFRSESNFSISHVWQEDKGFRAAKIRNKAVAKSNGNYLIFLDGDCLTFPTFVKRHIKLAEAKFFVRGSRVMLSEEFTYEFIQSGCVPSSINTKKFLNLWRSKKVKRLLPLINIPFGHLRKYKKNKWFGVKTCNLGVWRNDFMAVNGFDERYISWGHEDADLAIRLIRYGICRKEGVNAVAVLHLWHPLNDRTHLAENIARLKNVQKTSRVQAELGISQYS